MMSASPLESGQSAASTRQTGRLYHAIFGAVCAGVIGLYAVSAESGWLELLASRAGDTYYNLLAQGFRAGQLNLKREVPRGLAQLADPYDPRTIQSYLVVQNPLLDESYYKGRLYLYFGATPALVLFWPYAALTGHPLLHKHAVVIFFSVGFLASLGLLWTAWRRYFAGVGVWVAAAGAVAAGWADLTPVILQRCDVYEVAISCGYALTMLTLLLLWRTLHAGRARGWSLAGASLAYGLAVGARPSLLLGAVILLLPMAHAWREKAGPARQAPAWTLLLAGTGPMLLLGLGVMLYNSLRFDSPLEFGLRYVLSSDRHDAMRHFGLDNLWLNFRVYFLEPAQLSGGFPFVHDIAVPSLPRGHAAVQNPFGILTNSPLVWLALAAPLVWRARRCAPAPVLRWLTVTLVLLSGVCALTLGFYTYACVRYEVEFLPALVLLATLGIFGLERALDGRRVWQRVTRLAWGLLVAFSVAFNCLAIFEHASDSAVRHGALAIQAGRWDEAARHLRRALALQPENGEAQSDLGRVLICQGDVAAGLRHLEEALRLKPRDPKAHNNLGASLCDAGRAGEGIVHLEEALRLNPDYAEAHDNLGVALSRQRKWSAAREHFAKAVELKPENAEAHNNLGATLYKLGKIQEAVPHLDQAVRLAPGYTAARDNLGTAHLEWGKSLAARAQWDEAIQHYKLALAIQEKARGPAHANVALTLNHLGRLYVSRGECALAEPLFERALAIREQAFGPENPNVTTCLNDLASCYGSRGEFSLAEPLYARSLKIKEKTHGRDHPTVVGSLNNLAGLYVSQGRYAQAEPLYQRALAIQEKGHGPDHLHVATALNHLGGIYEAQAQYARAEPLYQRAMAIRVKLLGPDDRSVATCLDRLARLYRATKREAEAQAFEARASRIRAVKKPESKTERGGFSGWKCAVSHYHSARGW